METITIIRPTTSTNRYGDTVTSWTGATETDVEAIVYPRASDVDRDKRDAVIIGLTVLLPDGTDLEPSDRVRARGYVHTVQGEPGDWRSPWGWRPGLQVDLERVEG